MTDGVITGSGNSYLMRSMPNLLAQYPTWEAAAQAMQAGTFPLDLIFNSAGWQQIGDFINKFTMLKDSTAALYGKDATAVPDDILVNIHERLLRLESGKGNCYLETGRTFIQGTAADFTLAAAHKPFWLCLSLEDPTQNPTIKSPLFICARNGYAVYSNSNGSVVVQTQSFVWGDNLISGKSGSVDSTFRYYTILSKEE